uniref:ATP synthase F0 subunit 8 n=1 Tax=Eurygaster testudinaria TaxID=1134731 RepID=A0A2P1CM04_9HEMI|nr:ATP synthase F0 subunit 8 [Eurygaster testudinaria]
MPQMAPLYWEILFFMFIMSLIMMSIMIYHLPKISTSIKNIQGQGIKQINWKW